MNLFSLGKHYPIGNMSDEDCFEIVLKHIGWYPEIYNIRWAIEDFEQLLCKKNQIGKRVFSHNNCLPCKNNTLEDMQNVKRFYPKYHQNAMQTTNKLQLYWGRDEAEFYSTFGKDLGQEVTCDNCKW